jgi:hypothetical protein
MAQSEQSTRIIKVVVIAVALGIVFYLFRQVYPTIELRTTNLKEFDRMIQGASEQPLPSWESKRERVSSIEKLKDERRNVSLELTNAYLKLVGGSIATIIAAFLVIRYLTGAKGRE